MAWEYSKNKKCIYNWRSNNLERCRELNRKHLKKHRLWKSISIEFFNILIN
jgi:hypothetical protein